MGAVGQSKHFIFLIFMQYDILPTTISILCIPYLDELVLQRKHCRSRLPG